MKKSSFILCIVMTALILAAGYTTLGHNPLEGWKGGVTAYEGCPFAQTIIDDYRNYIRNLPAQESSRVDDFNIRFYEDAAGQRAVEITIPINGIRWKHVLIYDKGDKRVKAMKYAASRYMS